MSPLDISEQLPVLARRLLWHSKSSSRQSLDFQREEAVLAGKVVSTTSIELLGAEGSGPVLLNLPFCCQLSKDETAFRLWVLLLDKLLGQL